MYSDKIMQIFANPKNVGIIKGADGTGEATNEFGEVVKIFISAEDGIIKDAKFKAYGSVVMIATGSVLTSMLKGQFIDNAINISNNDLKNALGGDVEEEKLPSLVACKDAMLLAIKNYRDKFESAEQF